jgi:hypothetical protein
LPINMIRETRRPIIAGGRRGAVLAADRTGGTADPHKSTDLIAALTRLKKLPQVCSLKFPTCGRLLL